MKIPLTLILLLLVSKLSYGQYYNPQFKEEERKKIYLGPATGFNYINGLLGGQFEYNFTDQVSAFGGVGIGSWGYKLGFGFKYYPQQFPFKSAIGLYYAIATGLPRLELNQDSLVNGQKVSSVTVPVSLQPVHLINFTYSYYWKLGKHNRFHLEAGYSIAVNRGYNFTALDPKNKPNGNTIRILNFLEPGGILLGIGFTFALD